MFPGLPHDFELPSWVSAYGPDEVNPRKWRNAYFVGTSSTASASSRESFTVPKHASELCFVCIGSGAGGGGGFTAGSGSAKGGGGGGGSGAIGVLRIQAIHIPRTLVIYTFLGGLGGTGSGVAGSAGGQTWISDISDVNPTAGSTLIMASGNAASGGGVAGTAAGSQAGGSAEVIATAATCVFAAWGTPFWIVGRNGTAAGALGGNGVAITWGTAVGPLTGGTGGGSSSAANAIGNGGTQTGSGWMPTTAGGTGVAGGPGNPGNAGVDRIMPGLRNQETGAGSQGWASQGGTGGGSSATAGAGGIGGPGGTGGGGGGGGAGVTGAAGGRGGPGVLLISWT